MTAPPRLRARPGCGRWSGPPPSPPAPSGGGRPCRPACCAAMSGTASRSRRCTVTASPQSPTSCPYWVVAFSNGIPSMIVAVWLVQTRSISSRCARIGRVRLASSGPGRTLLSASRALSATLMRGRYPTAATASGDAVTVLTVSSTARCSISAHAALAPRRALARGTVATLEQAGGRASAPPSSRGRRRRRSRSRRRAAPPRRTGRSAPLSSRRPSSPSRVARKLSSRSASGPGSERGGELASCTARQWTSATSAARSSSEDCASSARISSVPNRGCGRRSHHR